MNQDMKNLKHFMAIHKNLKAMEESFYELEEYGVSFDMFSFYDAYLDLDKNIEEVLNYSNLTDNGKEKYAGLMREIYSRLRLDYPQLYEIAGNFDEVFSEALEATENAINDFLKPYAGIKRPFFACGFSSFSMFVPVYSLLGFLLSDKTCSPEGFIYNNGTIELDIVRINKQFDLIGQEYELYEKAFVACYSVLKEKLSLRGSINCYVD